MTLPNFFIAGAAKSGTTSLDKYLAQHPEIYMAPRKETHYFASPDMPPTFKGPGDEAFTSNLIRDAAEYESMFVGAEHKKARGESSVYYLYYPNTAERLARTIDDPKIILVLRHPVDRAHSAYMHLIRDGRETLPFPEALAQEKDRMAKEYQPLWYYMDVGRYARQLDVYFRVFGRDRVKVIWYDEFNREPLRIMTEVFRFLGVDDSFVPDVSIRYNATGVPVSGLYDLATKSNPLTRLLKPLVPETVRRRLRYRAQNMALQKVPLSPEIRRALVDAFASEIRHVEEIMSQRLPSWAN
ncbi:MAG: sulfotransferase [Alicyclobacillus sp.]|nr:sulfotransferase [Alicyclobacillus sp.]